ncbi:hypothetical protein K432DRAFT_398720 [Lepidopterella palustris CBS 459.81]|uniref:Uncharacterized protein n=1 Tax=Lepidopterella palustris CBS 459.81 TaxID=1314670 RepID=A0A8E2DXX2_9PEZI|nr:hypothetical protein K432DRAFT_398720 [Lepidopterella palustris CBS 459.81]
MWAIHTMLLYIGYLLALHDAAHDRVKPNNTKLTITTTNQSSVGSYAQQLKTHDCLPRLYDVTREAKRASFKKFQSATLHTRRNIGHLAGPKTKAPVLTPISEQARGSAPLAFYLSLLERIKEESEEIGHIKLRTINGRRYWFPHERGNPVFLNDKKAKPPKFVLRKIVQTWGAVNFGLTNEDEGFKDAR